MPREENYSPWLWATLVLVVLILVAFQLYIFREPQRIQTVQAADKAADIAAGEELFQQNCASCHGVDGLGEDAPALNNLAILKDAPDTVFFDLTANGMPGTEMPAWSQARGGPFTDEQIWELVAFIRSWEPTAPDLGQQRMQVDAKRGARIFAGTCAVCHGAEGKGGIAPALNVPERLQQFDNDWYAETIAKGRPSKGMPVWGTVLSPQQIGDLVALIDAWRQGEEIIVGDVTGLLADAVHALEHGEVDEARELLEKAIDVAEHEQADVIEEIVAALDAGNVAEAPALIEQAQGMGAETPEVAPGSAQVSPGVAHLQEAVHALEHDELDEAIKVLTEAMELLPPGDLFEAAEHGLEDIEAGKADEAMDVLTTALRAEGILLLEEPTIPAAETPETTSESAQAAPSTQVSLGVAHLQEAVHALEHDELDEAIKVLTEAMELLPPGDLFEAAEHGLEDIEAGKADEAMDVLTAALRAEGILLLDEPTTPAAETP